MCIGDLQVSVNCVLTASNLFITCLVVSSLLSLFTKLASLLCTIKGTVFATFFPTPSFRFPVLIINNIKIFDKTRYYNR